MPSGYGGNLKLTWICAMTLAGSQSFDSPGENFHSLTASIAFSSRP